MSPEFISDLGVEVLANAGPKVLRNRHYSQHRAKPNCAEKSHEARHLDEKSLHNRIEIELRQRATNRVFNQGCAKDSGIRPYGYQAFTMNYSSQFTNTVDASLFG